jgi:hypothetical protein
MPKPPNTASVGSAATAASARWAIPFRKPITTIAENSAFQVVFMEKVADFGSRPRKHGDAAAVASRAR